MMQALSPFHSLLRPVVVATLAALTCGPLAWAQTPPRSPAPADSARPAAPAESPANVKQREQELEKLRAEQRKAAENEAQLKREIETLAGDRRKFNQQIIESVSRVGGVEDKIAQVQTKLAPLDDRDQALRSSLGQRRDVVIEVLAALQRIGRQSPPALLIRTEDALQAVRSAMMLGAILPEMKLQAEALAADLAELVGLRSQITAERDRLARELLVLAVERQRLTFMIDERQKRQTDVERALADERQRAAQLARQAEDLNQLIVKLEQSLDTAARAAKAALRSSEERKADNRPDLAAFRDPGRLTPAIAFASAKGMLPLPVNGPESRSSEPRMASEAPKRAFRSRPVPAGRSRHRVMVGSSMPAPSAITANS